MEKLWTSVSIGAVSLKNRLAMAPMTRSRSTAEGVPTSLNAEYYGERASLGLIISEGTQPSAVGQGYLLTPGIYNDQQVAGWRLVTDAVHAGSARVFIQLMHVGRIAHPANMQRGLEPVGPSAVRPAGQMFTAQGQKDMPVPRELSLREISATIADFRHAAKCAIFAGADGVEIHAGNGYLPHQFLSANANQRCDQYGGSIENRVRFTVELAAAIASEIGPDKTGIHISPGNPYNDIVEGDTATLYRTLVSQLAALKLAYLHIVQAGDEALLTWIRQAWPTALLVNRAGRPVEKIAVDIDAGLADVATVGQFSLANPDLVARLQTGSELNKPDPTTFYGGGERGYTDYPLLVAQAGAASA